MRMQLQSELKQKKATPDYFRRSILEISPEY